MSSSSSSSSLPPLYATSLAQGYGLPLYSENASDTERVIHTAPSSPSSSSYNPIRRFVHRTDHLEVDMGDFPYVLMHPAYGARGVVSGTLKFTHPCSYVSAVTVKLEGLVSTAVVENARVAVPTLQRMALFSKTVQLVSDQTRDTARTVSAGSTYPFSIPFPTHTTADRPVPLPPSYAAIHPGVSTHIDYRLQVEIKRKGMLRRNEILHIPVLYLPKSHPPSPTSTDPPICFAQMAKPVVLAPTWPKPEGARCSSVGAQIPCIQLFVPMPRCFPSGDSIPLAVDINCASSPALAKLYAPGVQVLLIKRRKIWVADGRAVNIQESVLATGVSSHKSDSTFGSSRLSFNLGAGEPGCETGFAVNGAIEVSYVVRVIARPPPDIRHLPTFRVDEVVQLTTDRYEDPEMEILLDARGTPALGLTTLRPQY
ncbi:hypothetical protein BDW22DRAFT_1346745 [Trametopsis cervina]|nr:hypothetical protein BDW22DRAFT_1346745 [Trametopsis cervina]